MAQTQTSSPTYYDCENEDDIRALQLALAESLREAAAAGVVLEEPDSEPCEEPSQEKACQPTGWAYVVWKSPGADVVGIHCGSGAAWAFLQRALDGYDYSRGHRLRRASDFESALELYTAECARHGASRSPRIFRH